MFQSGKMESDIKMHINEFAHVERISTTDIHRCLLNIYGDQTVDLKKGGEQCDSSMVTVTCMKSYILKDFAQK